MAINGYFGQPRSGKSYSVVEYVVIPALKQGRHVITNIPLESDLLVQVFGGQITQLDLDALDDPDLADKIPHGAVAILDESWRRWPAGQKVSQCSKKDLRWLKEHGHRVSIDGKAMQIILVTQVASDLASWVRALINHSFHMAKLDSVGADKRFSIKVYKGCPTGDRIPQKLLVRDAYGTYKPDIYQYYRSATQSESETLNVGDEKAIDKRANIWGSTSMKLMLISMPILLICGLWGLKYFSEMPDRIKAREAALNPGRIQAPPLLPIPDAAMLPSASPASKASPQYAASSLPVEPPPSPYWRVAGYIHPSAEPPDTHWDSIDGYGPETSRINRLKTMQPQAIMVGMNGVRYFPLSKCHPYEDGINYYCDLDGQRVTPWSGQFQVTESFQASAGARSESVPSERSDLGADSERAPKPASGARITIIEDTSRTPRTLLGEKPTPL